MSLFEDLVEELKEENLLEETVIESRSTGRKSASEAVDADSMPPSPEVGEEASSNGKGQSVATEPSIEENEGWDLGDSNYEALGDTAEFEIDTSFDDQTEVAEQARDVRPEAAKASAETGKEYFRRRATDEVKTLQMVDHIITRIEKEQAKINSAPYDDLKVKQSLHKFLQLDEEANSAEVAEIEFLLLQETENWYSALTIRDKELTVENLRSYCDTAVPALSSQALLALARFFRNAPFSELVRAKFDLIITKLYTADAGDGRREATLPVESLVLDIQDLYKDWASVPLYSTDEENQELAFGAMGFNDFIDEVRKAHSFDDLVSKDFFRRLNEFKEKANESFFAPDIVAAAIRCNVEVGNRYLELIENEYGGERPAELNDQYGFLTDSAITEAIRKVFEAHQEDEIAKAEAQVQSAKAKEKVFNVEKISQASTKIAKEKAEWYKANKKLVIATALTVAFGIFYFFFSGYLIPSSDPVSSGQIQEMNLEDSEFATYINSARINKDIAYAITNEEWAKLTKPQKEEMMKRFLATGADKGFSQINFLDTKGQKVGYVSMSSVVVID
ncbi:MAG: hypothetical protein DWQ47_04880 [Acidobacteria bacterium]|nr:MAG: hypothetical protein DWQ32_08430 [Acidobacteriota bacterium]REK01718.1 MAG: hypothetical protein DWQ38_04865 [Acidobacteriota bacterium]REK14674.1 MAG: hypothetical protein DWQ43_14120 [Acidobacteriota bacterium]REK45389.1 MAG: hypothetical protein DWQ47_04880 [Acidobacteriota bacterium]